MIATLSPPTEYMGRRNQNAGDTRGIKIGARVYKDVRTLAAFYGDDGGPWLTKFLEPLIAVEMAKMGKAIQERDQLKQRQK